MVKCVILDVDGVMTDGTKIYDTDHNTVYKRFCDRDFTAIKRFQAKGVRVILLSGDSWNIGMATVRGIEIKITRDHKLDFVLSLPFPGVEMCYVGDDIFDVPVLDYVGYPFVVQDAIPEMLYERLSRGGGHGAVAELYDELDKGGLLNV